MSGGVIFPAQAASEQTAVASIMRPPVRATAATGRAGGTAAAAARGAGGAGGVAADWLTSLTPML